MMKAITIFAGGVLSVACAGTALPPLSGDHPASPDAPQAAEPRLTVGLGRPVRLPVAIDGAVSHAHHMGETPGSGASAGTEPGQMPMAHEHGAGMGDMHAKHHGEMAGADDAAKSMPHEHAAMPEAKAMPEGHGHGGAAAGHDHAGHDHAGHAHPEHGAHWMAPPEAAARVNPVPASPESIARGASIFAANCVTCHGASGEGDGPLAKGLDPKPANLAAMATEHSDGDFAWKVAHGRGAMPAWKDILSEEEIWHTVNYIKSLGSPNRSPRAESQAGSAQHGPDGHQHAAPGTEAPR